MLVSFEVENWMSYKETAEISLLASQERRHGEHVARVSRLKARILPISAIFGANASGKTNLFSALAFAQKLVVKGLRAEEYIPVVPFLGEGNIDGEPDDPSRFCFEILTEETLYIYEFTVARNQVISEQLTRIKSVKEITLFTRHYNEVSISHHVKDDDFISFAGRGLQNNQLFINYAAAFNVEAFKPIVNWFANTLTLVSPDGRFGPTEMLLDPSQPAFETMQQLLSRLDTGIAELKIVDIPFEYLNIPRDMFQQLYVELDEGKAVSLQPTLLTDRTLVTKVKGKLVGKRIVAVHETGGEERVQLDLSDESEGVQRLLQLLPVFISLTSAQSNKVFVVDELDRSIHTELIRELLEMFLLYCDDTTRAQLIFSSHNVMLLDQNLLRRDELWFTERNRLGETTIVSLAEFEGIRYDRDIRKYYLDGLLGFLPRTTLPHKVNSMGM